MTKLLLKIAMYLRHRYTKVFERTVLKKAKHTTQEIQDAKSKLQFFQHKINSIADYTRELSNLSSNIHGFQTR